ncbi:MerR family transcriptional regulator [Epidermidibacterium keratini]|uniref:MerR family transcriptional regulator n=1 Tax=Epidermidibacterium keratini TaxID=1891644 RepID=A0A7L4YNA1_9ACTN|nr:MerR family transcriptional regulator [Epidermidibacterium keratini]QHC00289.1 MerR family transcriptional regulator [Epidermidibacterium keratini]
MTTAAVSAEAGYSVQQVRDLERLGVIAPAARSANGYRQFSTEHVRDLHAYRGLAFAVGPVEARRAMREIRLLSPARGAALIGGFHSALNSEREQALLARHALDSIGAEAETDARPAEGDAMTITELSQALGLRTSTLRFWETVGLLEPERKATRAGTARSYPVSAIRDARIAAALRAGGYRIPDVHKAITALRELSDVRVSLVALERRLDDIAERTLALLRAGTVLAQIIDPKPDVA